eukprot:7634224-Pyramimonas_sp.AAC.1
MLATPTSSAVGESGAWGHRSPAYAVAETVDDVSAECRAVLRRMMHQADALRRMGWRGCLIIQT